LKSSLVWAALTGEDAVREILAGEMLSYLASVLASSDAHAVLRSASDLGRCYVPACPMPALLGTGECAYHRLEREQPQWFESCQASRAVLVQSIYGAYEYDPEQYMTRIAARARDRRRQLLERANNLEAE
jgi:hypothetical protein